MAKSLFIFDGNIGMTPELRWQPGNEKSGGEARPLLKFNVKYDRLVKTQNPDQPYEALLQRSNKHQLGVFI